MARSTFSSTTSLAFALRRSHQRSLCKFYLVLSIPCPLLSTNIYFLMMKFVDELPLYDQSNRHQSSGWKRLDVHARRVRILYMEPLHIVISPNIYLRIRATRDAPLLPGLKKIHIPNIPSLDLSSALFLASGSTLSMIQLDSNAAISDREFFVPFLSLLYIKSPGLSHLALRGDVLSASVEPIYRFTELQSLELRFCNPHSHPRLLLHLHKLGRLPRLLNLIIDAGDLIVNFIERHSTNPIPISNPKFRQLRRLQILGTTTSIECILDELKGLTNLSALKIDEVWNGGSGISFSSWRSSFEAISTFSAVEDIEITLPPGRYILSTSSLAPLFRLVNLKSFVINFNLAFSGSDDDFRLLAGSFPKLKKFVVPGPPSRGFGRTLACLYYLSRECPDLREIKIAVSSNISDNLNAIKKLPHPIVRNYQHPLEKLYIDSDFGQLQPIQLVQVAQFLDLIFPNLSILETDNSKMTEAANWTGIHELRFALQNARINPSSSDI